MNPAVGTFQPAQRLPWWRMACVLIALCGALFAGAGCASHQATPETEEESTSIERPAVPLEEEETLTDRIGQVGVVILVLAVTIGGILLPILLLK
jgi:hypothetical protein